MKWFQHTKKHICFSLSCYQFFGFFQWTSCLHGAFWQINIVAKSHKSVSKFTNTSFLFERTACKACFWKKIKNSIWNVSFVWSVSLPTWFFVWTNLMAKPRNVGEWRSQNSYTEAVVWRSRETFFLFCWSSLVAVFVRAVYGQIQWKIQRFPPVHSPFEFRCFIGTR